MICNHTVDRAREHIKFTLSRLIVAFFALILIFMIFRGAFLYAYALDSLENLTNEEIYEYLKISFLFDLKYVAILYIPVVAISLLLCFRVSFTKKLHKILSFYDLLTFLIVVIISTINFYYYKTYTNYIDAFIFSFFSEDPEAVIGTIINNYPLFKGLGLIILLTIIYFLGIRRLLLWITNKFLYIPKSKLGMGLLVLALLVVFVGANRGSFTTFPLRQNDIAVTSNNVINKSVPNGVAAIYWAYKWHKEEEEIKEVSKDDLTLAFKNLGLKVSNDDLFISLKHTTKVNPYLKEHKPNIVMAIMESMSTHLLSFESSDFDIYGALKKHAKEDYFFLNFISEGNGTIDSITRILLEVPDLNLSTSSFSKLSFPMNVITPFKGEGYNVVFITTGFRSWRNIGDFLVNQGVDEVFDRNDILKVYPNATFGEWGLDDEFAFNYAYEYLKTSKKPSLIFILSITNHPPYKIPESFKDKKLKVSDKTMERFKIYEREEVNNFFTTFKYANNSLGEFISKIKEDSNLKDKTFIAATGDHNIRGIGYSKDISEEMLGHAVPFYLYIPKNYQEHENQIFNSERFGSHKDIFRTIFEHSLSNVSFYSIGCDLLSEEQCDFDFALNSELIAFFNKNMPYACVNTNSDDLEKTKIGILNINKDGYLSLNYNNYNPFENPSIKTPIILSKNFNKKLNCQKALDYLNLQEMIYDYNLSESK